MRLINERDWDVETNVTTDIDLDLAYIKLSDMFAPGLSATIGRQEILLGKGLMVGSRNPIGVLGVITAQDYNARKAFDAV
ncbi:MAG: hypothetical protein COZ37_07515, partial [bacterium (Candidatus Ratteibacteria) CG_4_10_14_3_um_filter_41_18]